CERHEGESGESPENMRVAIDIVASRTTARGVVAERQIREREERRWNRYRQRQDDQPLAWEINDRREQHREYRTRGSQGGVLRLVAVLDARTNAADQQP